MISPSLDYEDAMGASMDPSGTRIFEIVSSDYSPESVQFSELDLGTALPAKSVLASSNGYIVLSGGAQYFPRIVYVWTGNDSHSLLRVNAVSIGAAYIRQSGLPASTCLRVVSESNPSKEFKTEFGGWKTSTYKEITDARSMLLLKSAQKENFTAEELSNTDVAEGGSVKIWRVDGVKRVNLPKEKYGHFYSTDCYVLLYTFSVLRKDEYIIYYWLGAKSSADDRETTVLLARFMEESLEGSPVQVRILEGNEPAFFRRLFRGSMIVHSTVEAKAAAAPEAKKGGGMLSIFKSSKPVTTGKNSTGALLSKLLETKLVVGNNLYQVQGTSALTTFARRVASSYSSLNSVNCFIAETPTTVYLRTGKQSTEDENLAATTIANVLGASVRGSVEKPVLRIQEGNEPDDFWKTIGGKGEYSAGTRVTTTTMTSPRDAKLFLASTKGGYLKFVQVDNFRLQDLVDDEIFILDTFVEAIVWVGESVSPQDKDIAIDFAVRLNASSAEMDGRNPNTVIVKFQSTYEKLLFTRHFADWREDTGPKADEFQKTVLKELLGLKMALVKEDAPAPAPVVEAEVVAEPEAVAAPAEETTAPAVEAVPEPEEEEEAKIILPSRVKVAALAKPAVPAQEYKFERASAPVQQPDRSNPLAPEELKKKTDGIDVMHKEAYLDDRVFEEMFGMSRETFNALPKWKQHAKKKVVGLF